MYNLVFRILERPPRTEAVMLDGPMWGLTPDQDSRLVFRVLLTLLRLPGAFLLDIWWDGHTKELVPRSLELEELANSGLHLLPVVLVIKHYIDSC